MNVILEQLLRLSPVALDLAIDQLDKADLTVLSELIIPSGPDRKKQQQIVNQCKIRRIWQQANQYGEFRE